jgi:hypothetical protein
MNIKSILIGSLALGCVIGGTFFKMNSQDDQVAYSPRLDNSELIPSNEGRAEYMNMLLADPATGIVDPLLVAQARAAVAAHGQLSSKTSLGINWNQIGPDNVGGRTRAVHVDINNPNIIYAGSIAGGLFISNDGALSWTPVSAMQGLAGENLTISCITQTDNGRVFFGTGCTFEGLTGPFLGNGIYEYDTNTGAVLPVLVNSGSIPNNDNSADLSYTNAIAAIGNRLYLGTKKGVRWADLVSGSYPTLLSGWTNPIEDNGNPLEMTVNDIDVGTDGSLLVCFKGRAYTSDDGSFGSFTQIPATVGDRFQGAIAPSNSDVMYILTEVGDTLGTFSISIDRGVSWTSLIPNSACLDPFKQDDCGPGGQGDYDMAIAVDPGDWGHVLVGGVQLFEWEYNPGSSPIGGGWSKLASLSEALGFQGLYVHSDKHIIHWPTSGTVYIGHDGGVSKSTDNGDTWNTLNFGYNVTTFYDVATAANGFVVGGAQDNGTQLQTFGAFGNQTPLGTVKILSGDGLDCKFSNFGSGVVFATAQYGNLFRSTAGGSMAEFFGSSDLATWAGEQGQTPFHTVIGYWESPYDPLSIDSVAIVIGGVGYLNAIGDTIFPGDTIFGGQYLNYESLTNSIQLSTKIPEDIVLDSILDTVFVQDPVQSRLAIRGPNGIYITKDAARLNNSEPSKWFRVSTKSDIENIEFSSDGNSVFLGSNNGEIYRIDGLSTVNNGNTDIEWLTLGNNANTKILASNLGGAGVVGLSLDPNDNNNIIATVSGYTNNNHVYRFTSAMTDNTGDNNYEAIQGIGGTALPFMPVYDVMVDYTDNNKVMLATSFGIWSTDNAFSALNGAAVVWSDENAIGMAHVPVYAITQQELSSFESMNSGNVYLGTQGRGFYMATDLAVVSVKEEGSDLTSKEKNSFVSNLKISPNPLNSIGVLTFDLKNNAETAVKIFNLTGSLVKTMNLGMKTKGENKEAFNASDLSVGSYIISLESNGERSVAKFIVTR